MDKRRKALAGLTPASAGEHQEVLLSLAVNDPEETIRHEALKLVTDVTRLLQVLDSDPQASPIAARIVELDRSLATHNAALFVACLKSASDTERSALIRTALDPDLIAQTAVENPDAEDLLSAATNLGETGLSALEKRSRNKNKKINRYARDRMELLRTLKVDLAQHVKRSDDLMGKNLSDESTARVEHHVKALQTCRDNIRWINSQLTQFNHSPCDTTAIEHAIEQLTEILNTREASPAETVIEAEDTSPQSVSVPVDNSVFEQIAHTLTTLEERLTDVPIDPEVLEQKQLLTSQWMAQCDSHPPGDAELAVFNRVSAQFKNLEDLTDRLTKLDLPSLDYQPFPEVWPEEPDAAQQLWRDLGKKRRMFNDSAKRIKQLAWPEDLPLPDALRAFPDQLTELATDIDRATTFSNDLAERLTETVLKLHLHLDNGELTPAMSAHNEARKLDRCMPATFDHPARKSLKQIQRKLEELRDWQEFATSPKRQDLMDAIGRLADKPLAPADQAGRIKALRSEWIALGVPGNAHEYRLNDQFNQAAERAFEPCREYFAAQALLREENLQARTRMCDQLETYLSDVVWSKVDIRAAEKIMRTARAQWQQYHPVDKKAGKAVDVRFETAQQTLHDQIKAAGVANLAFKQNVVDSAQQILQGEGDLETRIQKIKDLQASWRSIGPTPRGPDQAMWKAFRQICDAVFEQRTQLNNQQQEQIQQAVQNADVLMTHIQTLRGADEPEPDSLADIRSQIRGLTSLPERQRQTLEKALADLEAHYQRCKRTAEAALQRNRLMAIKQWDHRLSEAELKGVEPAADLLAGAADEAYLTRVFDKREGHNGDLDLACRTLAVNAELLADLPSPTEDRELRLVLQVEQLKAYVGQKTNSDGFDDLLTQWCAIGAKDPSIEPLRERMFTALEKLAHTSQAKGPDHRISARS
ncbi:MAG: DUF349 domain-containing protein [Proteobacteria bacterium]|nr:DUF349 domain-containing protein [Pseudomonadota bacterium]